MSTSKSTYLFYDIETTGLNKCFDQVLQFAAIRTDLNLNELERHHIHCRLNKDVIPTPMAMITHRIRLADIQNAHLILGCHRRTHHRSAHFKNGFKDDLEQHSRAHRPSRG